MIPIIKEIPMLYTTEMVTALLSNWKTETRRLKGLDQINSKPNDWKFIGIIAGSYKDKAPVVFRFINQSTQQPVNIACPYGLKNDLIYVRETWGETTEGEILFYASDAADSFRVTRWKPNIHLKKIHSRIWLLIEKISVERLKNISHFSAVNEGVFREWDGTHYWYSRSVDSFLQTKNPIVAYKRLWIKINGKESWNKNPWVWVIKFKVLSIGGKPDLSHVSNLATHV